MSESKKKIICKFLRGGKGCQKRTCPFHHPTGKCHHYSHPTDCKFGERCRYLHYTDVPLQHRDSVDIINDPRMPAEVRDDLDSALDAYWGN